MALERVVRAGYERDSKKIGKLRVGERIEVLEARQEDGGGANKQPGGTRTSTHLQMPFRHRCRRQTYPTHDVPRHGSLIVLHSWVLVRKVCRQKAGRVAGPSIAELHLTRLCVSQRQVRLWI